MSSRDYLISKSNYTLKRKHQKVAEGTVYERDFMTTTAPGSWQGDTFPYNEGNFKMVTRTPSYGMRKHGYGAWVKGSCPDSGATESEYWTYLCMADVTGTTENHIAIKPDYGTMLGFAYYGGLYTLLKNTVNHIITYFPAELYVTSYNTQYWDAVNEQSLNFGHDSINDIISFIGNDIYSGYTGLRYYTANNLVLVSNPFEIDTSETNVDSSVSNPLRHFSLSSTEYDIIGSGDTTSVVGSVNSWEVIKKVNGCRDGELTAVVLLNSNFRGASANPTQLFLLEYYYKGKYYLLTHKSYSSYSVRPSSGHMDEFFDGLSDFGKLLLNRESTPLYTCAIDYPHETETGVLTYKKTFTWPTAYGYNLDIDSQIFNEYIDGLKSIAEFYDEGYTDNLWDRMTHDSIKNMDSTFKRPNSSDSEEDYAIGTSKVQELIEVFGWFFDNLKMSIDNIRNSNRLSYNSYGNVPDYFLTDKLELSGWDPYDSTNMLGKASTEVCNGVWDVSRTNIEFMRRLGLNSDAVLSRKGARSSIEMILSLFGLRSYDVAKTAYIQKYNETSVNGTENNGMTPFDELTEEELKKLYDYRIDEYVGVATPKSDFVYTTGIDNTLPIETYNSFKNSYTTESDSLEGLACTLVETSTQRYVIPWFTNMAPLDGNPYFQMKGGWGKMDSKTVDGVEISGYHGHYIYDETLRYINIVKRIGDIVNIPLDKLHNGSVCYVFDISDYSDYYGSVSGSTSGSTPSNYFYLDDVANSNIYGYDSQTEATGWVSVSEEEISGGTNAGSLVLYLESLMDEYRGNNPHVGYGEYDDGSEYLDYYKTLFKDAIDNPNFDDNAYDCNTGNLLSGITDAGFDIEEVNDNVKCWYFSDKASDMPYTCSGGTFTDDTVPSVGADSDYTHFTSDMTTFPFEVSMADNSESASFSVINEKKLNISFEGHYTTPDEFKDYFYASINPYLKQVLPSTLIYHVSFDSATV